MALNICCFRSSIAIAHIFDFLDQITISRAYLLFGWSQQRRQTGNSAIDNVQFTSPLLGTAGKGRTGSILVLFIALVLIMSQRLCPFDDVISFAYANLSSMATHGGNAGAQPHRSWSCGSSSKQRKAHALCCTPNDAIRFYFIVAQPQGNTREAGGRSVGSQLCVALVSGLFFTDLPNQLAILLAPSWSFRLRPAERSSVEEPLDHERNCHLTLRRSHLSSN